MSTILHDYKKPTLLWPEVDDYLDVIAGQLGKWYSKDEQDNIRREVLLHLDAVATEEMVAGQPRADAIMAAMRRFGNPYAIVKQFREARLQELRRKNPIRWVVWPLFVKGVTNFLLLNLIVWFTDQDLHKHYEWRSAFVDVAIVWSILTWTERAKKKRIIARS